MSSMCANFRCVEQINKANRGEISPEELKERQVKSFYAIFFVIFH